MIDQVKNMIIGIFVLTALAIVIFILLFLHPNIGDEGQVISVRFSDIDKVNPGTKVTFAGKQVGEVLSITDLEDGREGPKDEYGRIYVYELELAVDSNIRIYNTDEITLRTSGLLGERTVSIMPMAPKPGQKPELVPKGEILYAVEGGSLEDTMKELKTVAGKFDTVLELASDSLRDLRESKFIPHIGDVAENLSDITTALNRPDEWSTVLNNVSDVSDQVAARLPTTWDSVDTALVNLDATMSNAKSLTADTHVIVKRVSQGEGSVGKLLTNDDLYLNIKALLNKAETVADDVNHYGLMFHQDKAWQRLRARRMNLLQKLSTPQEFRNYFNDELDQITTSLARVTMVLEATEFCWSCSDDPCFYLDNGEFMKVFAELMRRVSNLQESLEMYNEQLIECEVSQTELR